ncbi:beta-eliminating lyase-related protein [Myxococcus sp. K15C18031901]|uniref:threonine aldolase family protein n=1 Tax=Myxococcus dinghuensis TaxID=2906761 RepID=UPI0020A71A6F|nr:beta-eliminating lyase-related protein [Myxococcus dinghuensis]MCP3103915.1 beta-eliminating lyase-related protein [Myxococcus dinghuensis]
MTPHRFSRSEFLSLSSLLAGSALLAGGGEARAAAAPAPVPATAQPTREQMEEVRRACRGFVSGAPSPDPGPELVRIGEWIQRQGVREDFYGNAELIQSFEKKVADLLGFEAGCFMPTGTMGQLIALRIYADAGRNRNVGVHPSSHHVLHEDSSHVVLHQLHDVILSPWTRPLLAGDVRDAREPLGTVSVELPVRWLGGQLQTWEQLEELKQTCQSRGVKLHMDGARLWECQPYYGRPLPEICKGFDSVYVSFYKTVGALGGAMLVGGRDFIREARIWRHRHGGDIFHLYPYVASAAMRLDGALERIPAQVRRAKSLSEALAADSRLTVLPRPVPTNMFRVFVRADIDALRRQLFRVAREDRIWLAGGFGPTRVPGVLEAEFTMSSGVDTLSDVEISRAFRKLLDGL